MVVEADEVAVEDDVVVLGLGWLAECHTLLDR